MNSLISLSFDMHISAIKNSPWPVLDNYAHGTNWIPLKSLTFVIEFAVKYMIKNKFLLNLAFFNKDTTIFLHFLGLWNLEFKKLS